MADGVEFKERPIVPLGVTMVVLDTCAVRQLLHEPGTTWDVCFKEMSADGYSFSLGEVAAFELISQVQRGSISVEEHFALMVRLTSFLNPEVPVLPSYCDVMGMIGAGEFDEFETRVLIATAWSMLNADFSSEAYVPILTDEIRDEEVDDWANFLKDAMEHARCMGLDISRATPEVAAEALAVVAADGLDRRGGIFPRMSIRQHLEVRYRFRQAARSQLGKEPYRPRIAKKKNDAMDLSMYSYLTLPAFVVTRDSGFISKLASIDSFQRDWFKLPEDLVESWRRGERPIPQWPPIEWIEKEKERSLLDFLGP
ncbi:hypothetical protein XaraCFBP7407_19160 [Xanthomonas arboricola pv. arracaciae]|uniref:hypothetical protein n=1 Tax=Xanthomonas arboricola TaxID=56448 RepID=UPI000CEE3C2C|nr:hypothetical protein [Xanthomonas arboricola]PPT93013.1 hypothetical protein XaraCFBP7407_19160 [Xanthomonas arboricola pv. arracaciae]